MKSHWWTILAEWKESIAGISIPKHDFPRLLKKLMVTFETDTENNWKTGFQKTGIYPLNKNKVL